MRLESLVEEIRGFEGIRRKRPVGRCLKEMEGAWSLPGVVLGPGDDAGVVEAPSGRYLLLAADAVVSWLVREDPRNAGRAAVLVNVNDVYAMGGRPVALVNVVAGGKDDQIAEIARGIREECHRLRVPMVGGHVSPEGDGPFLAASVVGTAGALLLDRNLRAGQGILLAVDLRGERWCERLLNWDSHAGKDPATLLEDLGILCTLAEQGLCVAARDVSNAGILGTLAMMLENARVGATVDLESIAVPEGFTLAEWLRVYPSYGFLLVCSVQREGEVLRRFQRRGIWAGRIGSTDSSRRLRVSWRGRDEVLFDLSVTGIVQQDA